MNSRRAGPADNSNAGAAGLPGAIDTLPILCESIAEFDEVTRLLNQAGREMETPA